MNGKAELTLEQITELISGTNELFRPYGAHPTVNKDAAIHFSKMHTILSNARFEASRVRLTNKEREKDYVR